MLSSYPTFHLRVPSLLSSKSARRRGGVGMAASTTCSELAPYAEHIKRCNRGKEQRSSFVPFLVDNVTVGFIHPSFLQHLRSLPKVFSVVRRQTDDQNGKPLKDSFVTLHHDLKTQEERTEAVNTSLKVLSDDGVIPGWRNEMQSAIVKLLSPGSLCSLSTFCKNFGCY